MSKYEISPYGNLLVYKKDFKPDFVHKIIQTNKLNGLRIFAHLNDDRLETLDFLKDYYFLECLEISTVIQNDFNYDFLHSIRNLKELSLNIVVLNKKTHKIVDLSKLTKLTKFSIGANQGFQGIENCQEIKNLFLCEFRQSNLNTFKSLKNLKTIVIKDSSIVNLEGVQSFRLLEKAYFGLCTRLVDISEINGLPNLVELTFETCSRIKTLKHIKKLPNLEILEIQNCKGIDSLDFLSNITSIQVLNLNRTDILDGNLIPAQKIKTVFYNHKKHYNVKLDTFEQDRIIRRNKEKLKELKIKK